MELLSPETGSSNDGKFVCVVNTHLYSNHLYPDVKLWQAVALLSELENFLMRHDLPLIICGDFNSEPKSAVYQYLSEGRVDVGHEDLTNVYTKMLPGLDSANHSVGLHSAMRFSAGEEPIFTNYTTNFKGTLDYIWYSPSKLRVVSYVDLPIENDVKGFVECLPNAMYPSDHLFLCVDVMLVGTSVSPVIPITSSRSGRRVYSNSPPLASGTKKQSYSRLQK